jgi:hypothetical protein
MQGLWTDFDKLGDCGKIYINFTVSFLKFVDHVSISVKLRFVEDAWITS